MRLVLQGSAAWAGITMFSVLFSAALLVLLTGFYVVGTAWLSYHLLRALTSR